MNRKRNDSHNNENICERKHGLDDLVELCFAAYKLLQKLIEILGFISFRMNPDLDPDAGFDPDVEIANVMQLH